MSLAFVTIENHLKTVKSGWCIKLFNPKQNWFSAQCYVNNQTLFQVLSCGCSAVVGLHYNTSDWVSTAHNHVYFSSEEFKQFPWCRKFDDLHQCGTCKHVFWDLTRCFKKSVSVKVCLFDVRSQCEAFCFHQSSIIQSSALRFV